MVQDALIKLLKAENGIQNAEGEIRNTEAYALKICRNLALDLLRARKKHAVTNYELQLPESASLQVCDSTTPSDTLEHKEALDRLQIAMDSLPEIQRSCWQLRDVEGLSYKQIAKALNLTDEQVKVYLFRARQKLRTAIGL